MSGTRRLLIIFNVVLLQARIGQPVRARWNPENKGDKQVALGVTADFARHG
jgi:hypothetical protein